MEDSTIREKIKKGEKLTSNSELRIFDLPDCKELLRVYLKKNGLYRKACTKLINLDDEKLFRLYSKHNILYKDHVEYVLKNHPDWLLDYVKKVDFCEETEVILINTHDTVLISNYISFRRLNQESELALFLTKLTNCKEAYLERYHELCPETVEQIFTPEYFRELLTTDEGRKFFRTYLENILIDGPIQLMLAENEEYELFSIAAKNNLICGEVQQLILQTKNYKLISSYIENQAFFPQYEVEFVRRGDCELYDVRREYLRKYKLCEMAEIELIKQFGRFNRHILFMEYMENHCFSEHAWQYYVVYTR